MHYNEFSPSAVLRPLVRCYWHISESSRSERVLQQRVFPDGCIDVIYNLGSSFHRAGHPETLGRSIILVGAMLSPIRVEFAGLLDAVGIRFQPAGAFPFLRLPLYEITDRVVPVRELPDELTFAAYEEMAEATDISARIQRLDSTVLKAYCSVRKSEESLARILAAIDKEDGIVSMDALRKSTNLGTRQFERNFKIQTGLTPKAFCRIARFRAALATMKRDHAPNWAILACHSGFYDQSHFIHEFKRLTGLTPTAYLCE